MLGATFSITGHQPLTDTPMMAEYTRLDLQRSARLQAANFRMPDEFPKAALSCSRAFYLLVDEQPEAAVALAKAIYNAIFGEGKDGTQIQSAATPFFKPCRCSAAISVTRIRAPEAPIGWPSAQAPPLILTLL